MDAKAFLDEFGDDETSRVCGIAGTSLVYFKQCVNGDRVFSRKLAERLEAASEGRLDKVALVFPDSELAA